MDFKSVAGDIVYKLEGKRWTEVQEEVISKLEEAYRLGFLDGEAAYRHKDNCGRPNCETVCFAQADGCSDDGEFVPGCV